MKKGCSMPIVKVKDMTVTLYINSVKLATQNMFLRQKAKEAARRKQKKKVE
jgi:hypothetical protein